MSKFHTWLITLSTVEDIDMDVARDIVAYLKKKCKYGYCITETATKRHLHAAVCFKIEIAKKHFEETIWSKVEKHHPTSIKRIALKSTVQYDFKWVTEYLLKDSTRTVLWEKVDEEDWMKFFPTPEQQEILQTAKAAGLPVTAIKDMRMTHLETGWIAYSDDVSYLGAVKYLMYAMNVERSIHVITDIRRLNQTAWALYTYRAHLIEPCMESVRYGNQMIGALM